MLLMVYSVQISVHSHSDLEAESKRKFSMKINISKMSIHTCIKKTNITGLLQQANKSITCTMNKNEFDNFHFPANFFL